MNNEFYIARHVESWVKVIEIFDGMGEEFRPEEFYPDDIYKHLRQHIVRAMSADTARKIIKDYPTVDRLVALVVRSYAEHLEEFDMKQAKLETFSDWDFSVCNDYGLNEASFPIEDKIPDRYILIWKLAKWRHSLPPR